VKTILTIILIVLGTVSYGQGFIGYTEVDVDAEFATLDHQVTKTHGMSEGGDTPLISLQGPRYEFILFMNDNDVVYESKIISMTYDAFRSKLAVVKDNWIKQGDSDWISTHQAGVVIIKMRKTSYSDFPVFMYSFEPY